MPSAPWVKYADLAARFGLSDQSEEDRTAIMKAAAEACGAIERDLGRRVLLTDYLRRFCGNGQTYLPLPFPPIRSVLSVEIEGETQTVGDADAAVDDAKVVYYDSVNLYRRAGFTSGLHNVRVQWSSGHDLTDAGGLPVPADLIGLTETVAMILFQEKDRAGDSASASGRGGSLSYLRRLDGVELTALNQLRDWRGLYIDKGIPLPGDGGAELGVFTLGESRLGG